MMDRPALKGCREAMAKGMSRVDVVLLTKNSEPTLEKCLDSIFENVPVRKVIVVDSFSTDGTLEILQKYHEKHHKIVIVFDKGTRATGRQKGIELVDTEWFMFVDSDVILCKDWFKKAEKLITPEVGAVWGMNFDITRKEKGEIEMPKIGRVPSFSDIQFEQFEVRGGCHDILIRTEATKGIKIPRDLNVYEDAYIKKYIEKRGWRVLATKNPFCIHDRSAFHPSVNNVIERVSLEAKYGSFIHNASSYLLRNLLLAPLKASLLYLTSRNTEAAKEHLQMYYYMFLGRLIAWARGGKLVENFG